MSGDLQQWVVQICHPADSTGNLSAEGAGTWVDDSGLIVTANHVLQAIDKQTGASPDRYDIGILDGIHIRYSSAARIEFSPGATSYDIAFLKCDERPPRKPKWTTAKGKEHCRFRALGFPEAGRMSRGIIADGEVRGAVYDPVSERFQLNSSEITRGFSGAPVLDDLSRIMGLIQGVLSSDPLGRLESVAFMISSDMIGSLCSDLKISNVDPYVGLSPFSEANGELFYGRKEEISQLIEILRRTPRHVTLSGPSGSGKTSLVNAGVLPVIRGTASAADVASFQWNVIRLTKLSKPWASLESERLDRPLARAIEARRQGADHTLLVLDQGEELFTECSAADRAAFLEELDAVMRSEYPITVLTSIRDDFRDLYLSCVANALRGDLLSLSRGIGAPELSDIIRLPAAAAGQPFGGDFVRLLIADCTDFQEWSDATVLPLLEFTLSSIWRARTPGANDIAIYQSIGRIGGSLARWAQDHYETLSDSDQDVFRSILLDLVYPMRRERSLMIARRRLPRADLTAFRRWSEGSVENVLKRLLASRLLVTFSVPTNTVSAASRAPSRSAIPTEGATTFIDVIHEALLQGWRHLREWIRACEEPIICRNMVADGCDQWTSHRRQWRLLLRGDNLRKARVLSAGENKHMLRPIDLEFIQCSMRVRLARIAAWPALLLLGACIVTSWYCSWWYLSGEYTSWPVVQSILEKYVVPIGDSFAPGNINSTATEALILQQDVAKSLAAEGAEALHSSESLSLCQRPWHLESAKGLCQWSVWDASQAIFGLDTEGAPTVGPEQLQSGAPFFRTAQRMFAEVAWPVLQELAQKALVLPDGGWATSRSGIGSPPKPEHDSWTHGLPLQFWCRRNDEAVRDSTCVSVGGANLLDVADACPELWNVVALAAALSNVAEDPTYAAGVRGGTNSVKLNLEAFLGTAQTYADRFRIQESSSGWSLFRGVRQQDPYESYSTAMALLAAIYSYRATDIVERVPPSDTSTAPESISTNVMWSGEHAMQLVNSLAHFFAGYDSHAEINGGSRWLQPVDPYATHTQAFDYQVMAELLMAAQISREAALVIPDQKGYIVSLLDRTAAWTTSATALSDYDGRDTLMWQVNERGVRRFESEDMSFSWYPWALATAALWYNYTVCWHLPPSERNHAQRAYERLVSFGQKDAVQQILQNRTWEKAELMLGLYLAANQGQVSVCTSDTRQPYDISGMPVDQLTSAS